MDRPGDLDKLVKGFDLRPMLLDSVGVPDPEPGETFRIIVRDWVPPGVVFIPNVRASDGRKFLVITL
jgi:hypothetical protein